MSHITGSPVEFSDEQVWPATDILPRKGEPHVPRAPQETEIPNQEKSVQSVEPATPLVVRSAADSSSSGDLAVPRDGDRGTRATKRKSRWDIDRDGQTSHVSPAKADVPEEVEREKQYQTRLSREESDHDTESLPSTVKRRKTQHDSPSRERGERKRRWDDSPANEISGASTVQTKRVPHMDSPDDENGHLEKTRICRETGGRNELQSTGLRLGPTLFIKMTATDQHDLKFLNSVNYNMFNTAVMPSFRSWGQQTEISVVSIYQTSEYPVLVYIPNQ